MRNRVSIGLCFLFLSLFVLGTAVGVISYNWKNAILLAAESGGVRISVGSSNYAFPFCWRLKDVRLTVENSNAININTIDVRLDLRSILQKKVAFTLDHFPDLKITRDGLELFIKSNSDTNYISSVFSFSPLSIASLHFQPTDTKLNLDVGVEGKFFAHSFWHRFQSTLSCDVGFAGPLTDFKANGAIEFSHGKYGFLNGFLSDIHGKIAAKDGVIKLESCHAKDNGIGICSASGKLQLSPKGEYPFEFIADVKNVKILTYGSIDVIYSNFINVEGNIKDYRVVSEPKSQALWRQSTAGAKKDSVQLPRQLQNIPFSDAMGSVVRTKKIPVRNVAAPYNASILENEQGFLLYFRHEVVGNEVNIAPNSTPFSTNIGYVALDKNLDQTEAEFKNINFSCHTNEDARVFKFNSDYFIIYNNFVPPVGDSGSKRVINIAKINPEINQIDYITKLDLGVSAIEKNWVPFIHNNIAGTPEVLFFYDIPRHMILRLSDPKVGQLQMLSTQLEQPEFAFWSSQWGRPRGGSPARLVDGEYLAFFHSSFIDDQVNRWYVMGAMTFEPNYPFRVTSYTEHPILFEGIYDTPRIHTAMLDLRCIFPTGFAMERVGEQDLIHVSCGENDCAVKVVTFDKDKLLKSLKKTSN